MIKKCVSLMVIGFVLCGSALAQGNGVTDEARDEILRRGNSVVHIDGARSVGHEASAAFEPPADDSHKWFITVISQANCPPCNQLLSDWKRSDFLKAWAKPDEPQKGWAFFNKYDKNDQLQNWRWKNIQLKGTPTILVQPPRNGSFGDPSTVVIQITGYNGDDKGLAIKLSEGVKAYIAAMKDRDRGPVQIQAGPTAEDSSPVQLTTIKGYQFQQPPFDVPTPLPTIDVPPVVLPPAPTPTPTPTPTPNTPPAPAPTNAFAALGVLLSSVLAGLGAGQITNLLLVGGVVLGLSLWRNQRKQAGLPLFLTDEQFKQLQDALKGK